MEWRQQSRISFIRDLPAEEAIYRKVYKADFQSESDIPSVYSDPKFGRLKNVSLWRMNT